MSAYVFLILGVVFLLLWRDDIVLNRIKERWLAWRAVKNFSLDSLDKFEARREIVHEYLELRTNWSDNKRGFRSYGDMPEKMTRAQASHASGRQDAHIKSIMERIAAMLRR